MLWFSHSPEHSARELLHMVRLVRYCAVLPGLSDAERRAWHAEAERAWAMAQPILLSLSPTGPFTREIVGMAADESNALLTALFAHALNKRFVHRFQWRPGSMAIWDNRCTWHHAVNDYHGHYRLMHRITLDGVPLSA